MIDVIALDSFQRAMLPMGPCASVVRDIGDVRGSRLDVHMRMA
jgi:hypothetical protein